MLASLSQGGLRAWDMSNDSGPLSRTRPKFEDLLGQMVEVPSISMDSSRAGDMRRMAEPSSDIRRFGGQSARHQTASSHCFGRLD